MISNLFRLSVLLCVLSCAASAQSAPNAAASAVTVVVQPGDTAYSLARRAGLSVEAFVALNNLPDTNLKVGQVLMVSNLQAHQVQPGETLYALSRKYGVSVNALRAANPLPDDGSLSVGQLLNIPALNLPGAVAQAPATVPTQTTVPTQATMPPAGVSLSANWRDNAQALMGVPYVWGGTGPRGTDCSGFVLQVFGPLGVKLPRVSADQARAGVAVDLARLQPGDLVFFDTVGGGKVTHVGIYLGNDTFANANSYRGQVTVDRLRSDRYWMSRYVGARRVLPDSLMASQ